MLDCPKCGEDAYNGTQCTACGFLVREARKIAGQAASHKPAVIDRGNWTREQWQANQRACQPWIEKCKAILADAAERHKHDAIPHALVSPATRGIAYDPEAVAERKAIQAEFANRRV